MLQTKIARLHDPYILNDRFCTNSLITRFACEKLEKVLFKSQGKAEFVLIKQFCKPQLPNFIEMCQAVPGARPATCGQLKRHHELSTACKKCIMISYFVEIRKILRNLV